MKKIFALLLVITLFLSISPMPAIAQPAPGGPFRSTIRLQNMGDALAMVSVTFYNHSGDPVGDPVTTTIEPKDVFNLLSSQTDLSSGEYSAVVSSDQPLASLSTFSDNDSGAAYTGFDQGSTSWFVPGLYDNYYSYYSNVYVQNVTNSPVNATLEIFAPGNSTAIYTDTKDNIPSFATVKWDQKDLPELSNNVFYAGKITADGDVVAITNIYGSGSTSQQLYSYNGYDSGGTKWYLPVVLNNYYGWNASVIIQNVTESVANVNVNYSTGYSRSYTIQPLSVLSIFIPHQTSLPSGRRGLFGAEITSNVDVVAMVNQSNTYNRAATYNGFLGGSNRVYAPGVMKRASIFSTSVTCQNVGNGSTRMRIEYFGQAAANSTSPSIPVGGTYIWYQPNDPLPNGYDGSAVIESLDGQNIACIINRNTEDEPYFSQSMDLFFSANGINE